MTKNNNEVYERYLKDLGLIMKEMAFEAKASADVVNSDFSHGYVAGFHRIVSLMQQQANCFNIEFENIGLDGIDADDDLI